MLASVYQAAGNDAEAQRLLSKQQRKSSELHLTVDQQHSAAEQRLAKLNSQLDERWQELQDSWQAAAEAGVPLELLGGSTTSAPWQTRLMQQLQVGMLMQ